MSDGWQETLTAQVGAGGTTYGSFTTAKTIINAQALHVIPAGWWRIGRMVRITAWGGIGSLTVTPGTITFQVMIGSVIAFTTGAIQMGATAHADLPFYLEILLTCRAVGNSTNANLMGMGLIVSKAVTVTAGQTDAGGGVNSNASIMVPATTPAVGTGFDSTTAQILDFFAGFSINDAANTVAVDQYLVESLN
jgi:hypothetical protein